jgi:molybdopterin converting factor small subunit
LSGGVDDRWPRPDSDPAAAQPEPKPGLPIVRVVLSSGFSRRYTGGKREFEIPAKSLRDVLRALDKMYPGLGEHLETETTVAIDGEIHDEPGYFQKLREGSEVFFIPKLEGG